MGLVLKVSIDLSGWYASNSRVHRAIENMRPWIIGPPDELNVYKARASFDRGDKTYPVHGDVTASGGRLLARGLKVVAKTDKRDIDAEMLKFGQAVLRDVKRNIKGGEVTGPARSPDWIARKEEAGVGNINMIGLTRGREKFVNALTVELGRRR